METTFHRLNTYPNKMCLTKSHDRAKEKNACLLINFRFHCSKQQGRWSCNSECKWIQPKACGSFERIQFVDDSSFWAGVCSSWRKVKVFYNVDKWGHSRDQNRLYDQSAFEVALYHWNLWPYTTRWDCDDWKGPIFRDDFWKVFVR